MTQFTVSRNYVSKIRDPEKILYQTPFLLDKINTSTPKLRQLEAQPTDRCNLQCDYCSYKSNRTKESLNPKSVDRALEIFDPSLVILSGGGEPTIYKYGKDDFSTIVRKITNKPRKLGLVTNGTYFPNLESWKDFEWVRVSLDAATAEKYAKMKGVNCYEAVTSNIEKWMNTETKNVGIGIVLQRENIQELPTMFKNWYETWETQRKLNIQLRPIREYPDEIPNVEVINSVIQDIDRLCGQNENIREFINTATNYQEFKKKGISFWTAMNKQDVNKATRCYMPFLIATIRPNGDFYPCDNTPQRDESMKLGNIEDSPEKIEKKQKDLVKSIKPRNCPPCRYDRMNIIIEEFLSGTRDVQDLYGYSTDLMTLPFI